MKLKKFKGIALGTILAGLLAGASFLKLFGNKTNILKEGNYVVSIINSRHYSAGPIDPAAAVFDNGLGLFYARNKSPYLEFCSLDKDRKALSESQRVYKFEKLISTIFVVENHSSQNNLSIYVGTLPGIYVIKANISKGKIIPSTVNPIKISDDYGSRYLLHGEVAGRILLESQDGYFIVDASADTPRMTQYKRDNAILEEAISRQQQERSSLLSYLDSFYGANCRFSSVNQMKDFYQYGPDFKIRSFFAVDSKKRVYFGRQNPDVGPGGVK